MPISVRLQKIQIPLNLRFTLYVERGELDPRTE